tara:strand:+ start:185 stop:301 length:117 start_codon:yes stop_codon:yes gene_type:complete
MKNNEFANRIRKVESAVGKASLCIVMAAVCLLVFGIFL